MKAMKYGRTLKTTESSDPLNSELNRVVALTARLATYQAVSHSGFW